MAFQKVNQQYPREVIERLNNRENIDVLDVREAQEWVGGHIPVAKHIPLGQLPGRINELNHSKEIVVVCHSGGRSGVACEILSEKGFNVTNMVGGMSSWVGEVQQGL